MRACDAPDVPLLGAWMDGAHQCILMLGRTVEEHVKAGHTHILESIPEVPVKAAGALGRHLPVIDDVDCNLCRLVCPVPGTIEMVEVPGTIGHAETWSDRVAQGRDINPGSMESTLKKRGLTAK